MSRVKKTLRWIDEWRSRFSDSASLLEPRLLILASHAVLADERQIDLGLLLPQQRLTLAKLGSAIDALRALDYRFVSPADVEAGLSAGKHCLLTFDDGYRNNLDAVSLLREREVPALFFVVPHAIEEGRSFWWDAVYRKARACGRSDLEISRLIANVKKLPPAQITQALRDAGMRGEDFASAGDLDRPMNRHELAALATVPGMFVGNHTSNHEILTSCDLEEGIASLRDAQSYLERIGGKVVPWVAYPNGNCHDFVVRMAEEAGLRWGVTLEPTVASLPLSTEPRKRLQLGRILLWGEQDMARQIARIDLRFSLERAAARLRRRNYPVVEKNRERSQGAPLGARLLTPRAYCVYVSAAKYSGQRRATELVISALMRNGYEIVRLGTPALDRDKDHRNSYAVVVWRLVQVWLRAWYVLRQNPGVLHVNLAQSGAGLLRDGTVLLLRGFSPSRWPTIISLHGSWFMGWRRESLKARWLSVLARRAFRITVLGADQRSKLLEFGVPAQKIEVVDNSCELNLLPASDVVAKHHPQTPVEVLFLAILVDSKGYPEFLEALVIYSRSRMGPRLRVTLCGTTTIASHSRRLTKPLEANRFIQERIDELRVEGWVEITWIKEAEGEAKATLFRFASIFVLPTKLDAQPLVLLEAMASGCAVLTTNVGQIAQSVGPEAGVVMEEASPKTIALELARLAEHPELRLSMGQAGQRRFAARFARQIHDKRWVELASAASAFSRGASTVKSLRIWFSYADAKGFSGQKAATLLVVAGMQNHGAECRTIPQPVLSRGSSGVWSEYVRYTTALLVAWVRSFALVFRRDDWLHVNLGQTPMSMIRDGIPLLFGRFGLGRKRVVVSLHGSLFMSWDVDSLRALLFGTLLRQAGTITVLGRRQQARLEKFGVPRSTLRIVPNSSDQEPLQKNELEQKLAERTDQPVRLLHLSSLIASKGYPQYLEALQMLAHGRRRLEAVLCGRIVESEFDGQFVSAIEAEAWITTAMATVNESDRVNVRWVRGAVGKAKTALFREADIFVMPTYYAVEAQPLVLLEAMAMGCAIITTNVGEISTILDESSALILAGSDPQLIAQAITRLAENSIERRRLARAAHERFVNEFRLPRHLQLWEEIFSPSREDWVRNVTT